MCVVRNCMQTHKRERKVPTNIPHQQKGRLQNCAFHHSKIMAFASAVKRLLQRVFPDCRLIVQAPIVSKGTASAAIASGAPPIKNIIILGWGGSKQRSLAKVADFYADRRVRTVSFIMPLGIPNFARAALLGDVIEEMERLSHGGVKDVSIHLFSNNGTWSYATLMELINSRNAKLGTAAATTAVPPHLPLPRIDRIVYDSGPHLFYEDMGIHDEVKMYSLVATSIVLGRAQYEHPIISPLLKGALYAINSVHRALRLVQEHVIPSLDLVPRYVEMNLYLRDESPAIPHLFMYSSDDGLVSSHRVEAFAAALDKRFASASASASNAEDNGPGGGGKLVQLMSFRGVEHTAPFFHSSTKVAYRQKISQFMDIPV